MTAGNNGAAPGGQVPPENDDPFAHLYRREDGAAPEPMGNTAPLGQSTGVPRTSYNQVRAVGERSYGQQVPQQQAHYAAPETYGGPPPRQQPPADDDYGYDRGHGRSGGGGNPLVLGAIAVVVAVVVVIGAVMYFSDGEKEEAGGGQSPTPTASKDTKAEDKPAKKPAAELPKADGVDLTPTGAAKLDGSIEGAKSADGQYISGVSNVGDGVTWSPEVEKAGKYTLFIRYGVTGEDKNATITVNGEPHGTGADMKNYSGVKDGKWGPSTWSTTYVYVTLDEGGNDFKISCEQGNKCAVNIDQLWLTEGEHKK